MNKERRKSIESLEKRIGELANPQDLLDKFTDAIAEAWSDFEDAIGELSGQASDLASEVEEIKGEEEEYKENMPESLQSGEKGGAADEAIEYLNDAYDKLTEIAEWTAEMPEIEIPDVAIEDIASALDSAASVG